MASLNDPILTRKRQTIDSLQRSLNEGEHGLNAVPGLMRQILQDRMWVSFPVDLGGELDPEYMPGTFNNFVVSQPPRGLGSTVDLLKRICHEDKDVLDMIDREIQGKVGAPPSYDQDNLISDEIVYNIHNSKPSVNGAIERPTGTSESAGLRRLRKVLSNAKSNNQPERAEKVERVRRKIFNNEMSVHAALIELKLRTPTFTIPVHTERAARAIKKRFTPVQIKELISLLQDDSNA